MKHKRLEMLFGEDEHSSLTKKKILLLGVGGVGSFCLDCLYRSGIEDITIVDFDVYDESNQNRQMWSELHLGDSKVVAMKEHYPKVVAIDQKIDKEWVENFDFEPFDLVLDAIDDIHAKIALVHKTHEKLTSQGLRVIGLATRTTKRAGHFPEFIKGKIDWPLLDKNLTFIGFIAIKDPLRTEAKETIKISRQAGIRTIIITGDHKLTARTVAAEVGLKVKAENLIVGEDLDNISDSKLKSLIKKIDVYARVSPHHKLRIVKTLQDSGEVVAMTGDGINDSPALKAADIGISLGTGTDIAKETSDIVLLNNNFATIISAIHQGRIIFKNIRFM